MLEPYYVFYQVAMVLSLLASLSIIVLSWRRRDVPGAGAMVALASATFVWTLGFLIETYSPTLEGKKFFNNVGYIGSMSVPVAWFIFAFNYARGLNVIRGWKVVFFAILPLIVLILVWSNDLHHLMWYDERLAPSGPFMTVLKSYGTFFWVALAYNYMLVIGGAALLLQQLFTTKRFYTGQAIALLIAVSLPLFWNALFVFDLVSIPRKDLTPVVFAISGMAIALGVMRFQLLGAVPFARRFIIDNLSDGILVFNMQHRLLEANPAALSALEADRKIIGKEIAQLTHVFPLLENISSSTGSSELVVERAGTPVFYEFDTVAMHDEQGHQTGWLAILRDTSERKRRELEYRTIIQTTSDGFWIGDMTGHIVDVNDAACRLTGYDRNELLKKSISDLEATETPEEMLARIARVKEAGSDRFESRIKRKDGNIVHVEVNINFLTAGDGRLVTFLHDITDRKQAEEERRQNADRLVNALNAAVEAMARTVEMRDPYTAGHQRRVTRLAVAIAMEMGYSQEFISGLRMAAVVHDIGKIKVPAEILSKADKLSDAEYNLVKLHPEAGYNILKTIEFPWPVAQIVLQHHERLDGSGYPNGTRGEDILMEARILALADVVESMSSHRPYRPAIGIGKALEEIVKHSGTLYDADAVGACVRLFHESDFSLD